MHLGMSGRFVIGTEPAAASGTARSSANSSRRRAATTSTTTSSSTMSNRRRHPLQRRAPLRLYDADRRRRSWTSIRCSATSASSRSGDELTPEFLAARGQGAQAAAESLSARPARDRRARQHLCLRGAVPRTAVAGPARFGRLPRKAARPRRRPSASRPAIRAVLEDAIDAGGSSLRDYRKADGSLGYFQHRFCRLWPRGRAVPAPGCGGTISADGAKWPLDILLCQFAKDERSRTKGDAHEPSKPSSSRRKSRVGLITLNRPAGAQRAQCGADRRAEHRAGRVRGR